MFLSAILYFINVEDQPNYTILQMKLGMRYPNFTHNIPWS